jgi:uncharacterized protein YktB (UPF0637 family)
MAKQLIKVNNEGSAIRIKNEDLKASIQKYNDGYKTMNEGGWQVAEAVHAMLTEKQWKDDFKSEREFIESVNAPQSTWNQWKTAVTFRDENPSITKGLNVNRVYIMAGLGDEAQAMLTWAKEEKVEVNSDKKLKEAIKAYKNRDAIDAEFTTKDEDPEDKEAGNEAGTEKEPEIVAIEYKGKTYEIPWKVLTKYEVKQ